MFWKFNLLSASQIDTLLDQEDVKKGSVTLEDILNEDDVLQECKGQNKRLLDFLIQQENMEELVNLVTEVPGEEQDEKARFKYPNTACEVLTSDVPAITDKLAGEEAFLLKIFAFLESEEELNPLQASFFSKVMGLLISRKSELMLEFLRSRDFVSHLVRHIGTSAIMDLLLRLITCIGIENAETGNECVVWLNEQSIIQKLVGLIDGSHSEDKHCNASQSLCDIIRIGRDKMSHLQERADDDPLLATIESQEVITDLLDHMFNSETKVESVLVNGLQVIQTLLEFRKVSYLYLNNPDGCQEQLTSLDTERLAHGVNNTLAAVSPRLKDMHELLVNPPRQHYHTMATTIGDLDPPLGNTRLQIVRLITSLLTTNTHSVNQELANLGTIAVIIDLFFKYLFNNFLHTQVEQCLCTILSMSPTELENGEESHPLLDYLFKDLNVLERILDAWEDHENNFKPGKHRPGYMGHLTRIANTLIEFTEKGNNCEKIKELCKDKTEESQQRWEGFVSGTLAEVNKQNTADLGGSAGLPGLQSSSDSEDPDFSHIPFPQESAMQQAFSDYQLQQMTSTFIDQFGFNEDEFAEQEERVDAPFREKISGINFEINADESSNAQTLFEQACNERMQQFDDPDSDEDLWEDKEITFSKSGGGRTSSPNDSTPSRKVRRSSDSEEDEQNSEESTDSEEELDSPRRIYQVPSTTTSTATSTTNTSSITSTTDTAVENMDVDSQGWSDFSKALATTTKNPPVDMETSSSPWEQSEEAQSTSNSSTGENWANFDKVFKKEKDSDAASSQNSENNEPSKTEGGSTEEKWANFTNFEEMESTENKTVNREQNDLRSVSPIEMDTNDESPAPSSSSRMAQYLVSGAADSSQNPTSSSTTDDNLSSPPDAPKEAWNTPRVPPVSPSAVPPADKTISSSSDTSSAETPSSTAGTTQKSDKSEDVDECSTEVSSSTQSAESQTKDHQNEPSLGSSTDVDTGLPVLQQQQLTSSTTATQEQPENCTATSNSSQSPCSALANQSTSSNVNTTAESNICAAATTSNNGGANSKTTIDFLDEIDGEFDDDDLNDNFNFLAGSGLMRSPAASDSQASSTSEETSSNNKIEEPSSKKEDPSSSTSETNNELNNKSSDSSETKNEGPSLDNKKIEEIRAQAQEALEEFSTTTGTSSAQNGPV